MADAILSAAAERIIALLEEQARYHINLVRGVEKEVRKLSDELVRIRMVLDDAEKRGVKETSIKHWLRELEYLAYEVEDVLDEWEYAILKLKMEHDQTNDAVADPSKRKVGCFIPSSCLCFKKVAVRHGIAKKIQNVKAQLDEHLEQKKRYNFVMSQPTTYPSPESWRVPSTSLIDLDKVHGRVIDRDNLVRKLVSSSCSQELGPHILSIVGVGGIGKTTLAQLVYNDSRVEECFKLRIWVYVSEPFGLAAIAKEIIESVKPGSSPNTDVLDVLLNDVIKSIKYKKFLLVLDDVWTEDYNKWEPLENSLKCGGAGSKILVTTRKEKVAKIMGTMDNDIHHLGKLSNEDCWLLLQRIASLGRNKEKFGKFEDIGKKIAIKCDGLPLATKTLGGLLRFKETLDEWENVLNSELWQLEEVEVNLFPHLLLSYNELSPTLKRCFSYCAVFPKGFVINTEEVIRSWIALGYLGSNIGDMELKGQRCFGILAMCSLFQDFKKDEWDEQIVSFKMHDIVHDFTQFLTKNGRVEATRMTGETCQVCKSSSVEEYRSLFWECKESPPSLCDCLTRLRVLSLRKCRYQSIPQGMEKLIHLRWLNLDANKLSPEDLKIIFQLYNLQTLYLSSCKIEEIPREIGNLIDLRHLDLSKNTLKELPESICGLLELQTLNVNFCYSLSRLPEGIHKLINLKHLHNRATVNMEHYPKGLAQLTGLRTLCTFNGQFGHSKLRMLKNLNCLSGSLLLNITVENDLEHVVVDAREAQLKEKRDIQYLEMVFWTVRMYESRQSSASRDALMDALEPCPTLQCLEIYGYRGSRLAGWITSLNQLRSITLYDLGNLLSLPPLGKLPCLEVINIKSVTRFQSVGRQFLGIIRRGDDSMDIGSSSSVAATTTNTIIAFPKLKSLRFGNCPEWKEWEDIKAEEEDSTDVLLMPCLTELTIEDCQGLTALPHRLLRKASLLERLDIWQSTLLEQHYRDGSARKSISQQNPRLQFIGVRNPPGSGFRKINLMSS